MTALILAIIAGLLISGFFCSAAIGLFNECMKGDVTYIPLDSNLDCDDEIIKGASTDEERQKVKEAWEKIKNL